MTRFPMFFPSGVNQVRMFLILFCLTLALQFIRSFSDQLNYFKTCPARIYGEYALVLGKFRIPGITPGLFIISGGLFLASLVSAAFGNFPRLSIAVALPCYFFYFGQIISLSYVNR